MWKSDLQNSLIKPPQSKKIPLAETIKCIRQSRSLTLAKLAEQSGLSTSTLSRIESGQLSPTFDTMQKICEGLEISIQTLLQSGPVKTLAGWRSLTRCGEGKVIETPHYRLELLCDDVSSKQTLVFRATILARDLSDFETLQSHSGQEQIVVQSGTLRIFTEHYTPVDLHSGDSFAFDSAMGHALVSLGDKPAEVLWISDLQTGY